MTSFQKRRANTTSKKNGKNTQTSKKKRNEDNFGLSFLPLSEYSTQSKEDLQKLGGKRAPLKSREIIKPKKRQIPNEQKKKKNSNKSVKRQTTLRKSNKKFEEQPKFPNKKIFMDLTQEVTEYE
jgi:hypothetical protein